MFFRWIFERPETWIEKNNRKLFRLISFSSKQVSANRARHRQQIYKRLPFPVEWLRQRAPYNCLTHWLIDWRLVERHYCISHKVQWNQKYRRTKRFRRMFERREFSHRVFCAEQRREVDKRKDNLGSISNRWVHCRRKVVLRLTDASIFPPTISR